MTTALHCSSCQTSGRNGYCAPLRCYCGHECCPAFPSYSRERYGDIKTTTAIPANSERMASSWAEREEPTWLDR